MRKSGLVGCLMMFALIFLSACNADKGAAATEETVSTDVVASVETTATSVPEAGECLACHTDKQRLIDTGSPLEESGESESKGVG